MAQAYDFALEKMGLDIASYTLWNDYIRFLKGVEAVGSYAENQKISAIRKIYQRGIVNPMINIEQLWYVQSLLVITISNYIIFMSHKLIPAIHNSSATGVFSFAGNQLFLSPVILVFKLRVKVLLEFIETAH